jgi:hypothetical protein
MEKINQRITGNNNIQVGGDYISTNRLIKKTEVIHDSDMYITDSQAKEIRDRIHKIAESRAGENKFKNAPYGQVFNSLYNRYSITKYTLLPKEKFDDAIKWLNKQVAIYRPKLKKIDNEQYRKDMYKAINAKANQIGVEVHDFANEKLGLKKPITSLKELSDARLGKLHAKLFKNK